jgi:hypothetical protein
MTTASGASPAPSRLLLAVSAAALAVAGVAVVMLAAIVLLVVVVTRVIPRLSWLSWLVTGGSSGIGTVRVGFSVSIVTILMLIFVAAAGVVALRVFRMVRAGDTAPVPPE